MNRLSLALLAPLVLVAAAAQAGPHGNRTYDPAATTVTRQVETTTARTPDLRRDRLARTETRTTTTTTQVMGAGRRVVDDGPRAYRAGKGCPPGLAKKHNGCLPPGQAKKMHRD